MTNNCDRSTLGAWHILNRGEDYETTYTLASCIGQSPALLIMGHMRKKNSAFQWDHKDRIDIDVSMDGVDYFSDTGKLVIEDPPNLPFVVTITNTHGKTQEVRLRTFAYPA